MIAKCANPACPVRFHYRLGGKFFRFHAEIDSENESGCSTAHISSHNVQHFWLCACCCHLFTLVYVEGRGVMLKPLEAEMPTVDSPKYFVAA